IVVGEDIEDPKGGVFRLTQRLSTEFPKQVFNSPLAESTILGVACGLAAYGKRPVFELQFIDFIYPGFNQLVTNISNLRWRSFGNWKCPLVIYAPYGAYLPGGSLWHSQANESALAHYPGLNIVIPSSPADAAGLLWTAMHGEDPVMFLIPKHLLWAEHQYSEPIRAVPLGQARRLRDGSDVTLVAWGNTVEKSLEALDKIDNGISVERIVSAIQRSVATKQERAVAAGVDRGTPIAEPVLVAPRSVPAATAETGKQRIQSITVPVMGEGIRNAKVVSLLKNPGDTIALDDDLCEVETDKAVYPIQSSFAGAMGEWKTKVGDTVEIGQELGTIVTAEPSLADQFQETAKESAGDAVAAGADRGYPVSRREISQLGSTTPATPIEPALSPTIIRKL